MCPLIGGRKPKACWLVDRSVFTADLHAHTRFFHGHERAARVYDPLGVRLLTGVAGWRGLDGVALTNHDYYREFDLGDRTFGLGDREFGLDDRKLNFSESEGGPGSRLGRLARPIPGIEISTTHGHLLVVGPDPPTETEPGEFTPEKAVELAHERDCAAIIAHPYRNSTVREVDADFDAIEVNGKGTDPTTWVRQLAENRDLPLVGGSDAHYPVEVGRAYTEVEAEELTPESVVAAIRDGRVTPRIDRSPSQQALRRAYKWIHVQKGWLDHDELEPPGLGTPPGEEQNPPPPRE